MFVACMMGARFSVVNVNSKFARRVAENIAGYGLAGRLVSLDQMAVERGAVSIAGSRTRGRAPRWSKRFVQPRGKGSRKEPRP